MFTAALFIMPKTGNMSNGHQLANGWTNGVTSMWWMLLSDQNERTTDTGRDIGNSQSFMLNERSQTQKATSFMGPFIWHSGKGKDLGIEIKLVVSRKGDWFISYRELFAIREIFYTLKLPTK